MDFIEGDFSANIHNDEIYNLSTTIHDFCQITSQPQFRLKQILDHLQAFRASFILSFLMDNPKYPAAQNCLHSYFQNHQELPSVFVNRFLSVISAEIQLSRQPIGLENTTLTANIIVNNVIPRKEISKSTADNRVANLRQELKNNTNVWSTQYNSIRPYQIKINMDDDFIQTLIREESNLNKTILESNRCNGSDADSFITSQIKYT